MIGVLGFVITGVPSFSSSAGVRRTSPKCIHMIGPGNERKISKLLEDRGEYAPYRLKSISIARSIIVLSFGKKGEKKTVKLNLMHRRCGILNLLYQQTRHFIISYDYLSESAGYLAGLVKKKIGKKKIDGLWFVPVKRSNDTISPIILVENRRPALENIPKENRRDLKSGSSLRPSLVLQNYILQCGWGLLILMFLWNLSKTLFIRKKALFNLWLLILFFGSFIVRYLLSSEGPGNSWSHLATAFNGMDSGNYGNTPNALLKVIGYFTSYTDTTGLSVNLVIGSLIPIMMALFLLCLVEKPAVALIGGVIISIQPLLIRYSGELSRHVYVVFTALTALWALARYHKHRKNPDLMMAWAAAILCCLSRPESAMVIAFLLLFSFFFRRTGKPIDKKLIVSYILLFVVYGFFYFTYFTKYVQHSYFDFHFGQMTPSAFWADPQYTPMFIIGFFLVGLILGIRKRRSLALWGLLSLLVVVIITLPFPSWGLSIGYAQYQDLSIIPFVVFAALGCDWAVRFAVKRARGAVRLSLVILLAVTGTAICYQPYLNILRRNTFDYEYLFMRDSITKLPLKARIYYVYRGDEPTDLGLKPPEFLTAMLGRDDVKWRKLPEDLTKLKNGGSAFFYRQSSCFLNPNKYKEKKILISVLTRCARAMRRFGNSPVFTASIPARSYHQDHYSDDRITVGLYAMNNKTYRLYRTSPESANPVQD